MCRISYAGETLHTSGEMADALLKYGAALASRGLAEAVTIPICDPDGTIRTAQMIVGIGNELLAVPDQSGDEPDCGAGAMILRDKIDALATERTVAIAIPTDELRYLLDDFTDLH